MARLQKPNLDEFQLLLDKTSIEGENWYLNVEIFLILFSNFILFIQRVFSSISQSTHLTKILSRDASVMPVQTNHVIRGQQVSGKNRLKCSGDTEAVNKTYS